MPRLYIISGCNGSGKTTASYSMLPGIFECTQFVNSDEFAKSLSPFNPEKASIGASRYMLLKIRYLFSKKKDFCIETTLATRSLLKMIKVAQEQGYYVTLLFFWLNSPDMAVKRVKARVQAGGHNIDEDTIRRRYYVGQYYLFKDYMPLCDHWMLADNSKTPYTMIAEGGDDNIKIYDKRKYDKILKMNEEYVREKEGRRNENEDGH
ncbi:MAG: zeta toxin family protein [Bacteroidales bacterium]|jgi:predicted ABC-type ATPase|nr:zeta toxin family protein [Bacteroidales bacterium]MDY2934986.1 zeta toxin family protein [Candidatus Cryptobacteroides sp.]MCH3941941.1 zeta toxin family protein [Bacteroidales bacterium]MCI5720513.1 zeta toxin family protein [Bacteroidales bacterium]MDD7088261.1 zeta toxin family protein [Bacteroidales bacterium]